MASTILTTLTSLTPPLHLNLLPLPYLLLTTTWVTSPCLGTSAFQHCPRVAPWLHDGNVLCRTGRSQTPHVDTISPLKIGIQVGTLVRTTSSLVHSMGSAN